MEKYGMLLGLTVLICGGLLMIGTRRDARYITPLWAGLCAVLGFFFSRLVFWLVEYEVYLVQLKNALSFFWIRDGGLSMTGALLGVLLGTLVAYKLSGKRAGLQRGEMFDLIVAPLALFIVVERLLEWLLLGEGFGLEMKSAGLLTVTSEYGPTLNVALLEALTALIIGVTLTFWKGKRAGDRMLFFLLFYSVSQMLFESLRKDSHMMWNFVHAQQLFSLILAACVFAVIAKRQGKLPQAVVMSLLCAGILTALEFALDGRIKVPFAFMTSYAKLIWYLLYVLTLALYTGSAIRVYHNRKKAVQHA